MTIARQDAKGKLTPAVDNFHPLMTYSIFGDEEQIFGYQGLEIGITFRAHDMRPSVEINYSEKTEPIAGLAPVNLEESLAGSFPGWVFDKSLDQDIKPKDMSSTWAPPGEKVVEYRVGDRTFQIFRANLFHYPEAKRIFSNMRILIPLFIEGGQTEMFDETDEILERWSIYLLYEVAPSDDSLIPYVLCGFSTTYQFWTFPHQDALKALGISGTIPFPQDPDTQKSVAAPFSTPLSSATRLFKDSNCLESPSRLRLSQFLIFPPYQRRGHGNHLYTAIFNDVHASKWTYELTVEDPTDEFDWLRDMHDYEFLLQYPEFAALSLPESIPVEKFRPEAKIPLNDIVPLDKLKELRLKSRIVKRQFDRMVEMHLLAQIPSVSRTRSRIARGAQCSNPNDRKYFYWCTYLKDRLYKKNSDVLIQIPDVDRPAKLQEVVEAVQGEYEERFDALKRKGIPAGSTAARPMPDPNGREALLKKRSRKRPVMDDDDESVEGSERAKTPRIN